MGLFASTTKKLVQLCLFFGVILVVLLYFLVNYDRRITPQPKTMGNSTFRQDRRSPSEDTDSGSGFTIVNREKLADNFSQTQIDWLEQQLKQKLYVSSGATVSAASISGKVTKQGDGTIKFFLKTDNDKEYDITVKGVRIPFDITVEPKEKS